MKKLFFFAATSFAISTAATAQLNAEDILNEWGLFGIISANDPPERTADLVDEIAVAQDLGELGGTSLTINGGFFGSGSIKNTTGSNVGISLSIQQSLTVEDLGSWTGFKDYAISNNSGTVNITSTDTDTSFGNIGCDIRNSGRVNLSAGSSRTISFIGGISGNGFGSVDINNDGHSGTVFFKTGSITKKQVFSLYGGTLQIENGATWQNNALTVRLSSVLDITGGNGIGTTGVLNYSGQRLTLDGGKIHIDINGKTAGTDYDQIVFSENAVFNWKSGKITVNFDYDAAVGDKFDILKNFNWSSLSKEFNPDDIEVTDVNERLTGGKSLAASMLVDDAGIGTISLTVIPEPSMFALFAGLGALVLVGTRRKRK